MKIGDSIPIDIFDNFSISKSIIIYFWSISCPACKMNHPDLQKLGKKYCSSGLNLVPVHMPRGAWELDETKVREVADELGIAEPLILDNDHSVTDRFGVDAVPTYFLFDLDGRLKRRAAGNFGLKMIEAALRDLFPNVE